MRIKLTLAALLSAGALGVDAETSAPLSAIEWLGQQKDVQSHTVAQPLRPSLNEAPTAQSGSSPKVTVIPLGAPDKTVLGLLPTQVTGLKNDLWLGARPEALAQAVKEVGLPKLPASQALLFTLLLNEAADLPVAQDAVHWNALRIRKLLDLGAVEPAAALATQANSTKNAALFSVWMDATLLTEGESSPCSQLVQRPNLSRDPALHIYCTALSDDFETAALLFGTNAALGLLDPTKEALLARFLDPDMFEDLPAAPLRPDALEFRLFEAAGAPLSTTPLPRAFAYANLREQSGWKAQLEAAERLTRAGALSTNRLLGLYTSRKPAASGGIWDRVSAWQRLDAALTAARTKDIAQALPAFWRSMKSAGLEIAAADLFAPRLTGLALTGPAAEIAFQMQLLSAGYEQATSADGSAKHLFLSSVARGTPDDALAESAAARAVADAFSTPLPPQSAPIGLALLRTLGKLEQGAAGDAHALTSALQGLRSAGLEDAARRAALQVLILKDSAT